MAITLLTVLRSGGRYDARWVERLGRGARRAGLARTVCLTDTALDVAGVETRPLRHRWPGWWSKIEAFRPGLVGGAAVLCDLDTVFAGPAPALAADDRLTVLEDFFHRGRASSALVRFPEDGLAFVYHAFAADPERRMTPGSCGPVPNAVHGDQVVLDHLLRRAGVEPAFWQRRHPGLVEFYRADRARYDGVVVFIGESKPDAAGEPIASLWAGETAAP
ncbi:MAG: hypothetical protein ACFBWO_12465 [Paracoccaceae bacterium]